MAPVAGSVTIDRRPAEVFEYVADIRRRGEWQKAIVKIEIKTPELTGAGVEVLETRRVGGGQRTFRWRVSEYDPPTDRGLMGIGNPVSAIAHIHLTPLEGGARTEASFEIDFEARGVAKPLAFIARLGARREVPRDLARLKRRLE
jgi:Polyketide cyclase / dehydrase and lipid transport